jgi:hypothetical protein
VMEHFLNQNLQVEPSILLGTIPFLHLYDATSRQASATPSKKETREGRGVPCAVSIRSSE